MKTSVDKLFFEELAGKNPEDVCRRALCRYDVESKCYFLSVWGDDYAICPNESTIRRLTKRLQRPHDFLDVFIIHYLLKAKEIEICNDWISEKDIPGGAAFFRGPHEIPSNIIAARYKEDLGEFRKCCEQLDGVPLNMADVAYVFKITPIIPVAVLFWEGDDDFPPESKLLFDKSLSGLLALDIIFALAADVCARIIQNIK